MAYETIRYEAADEIATVTLDRPAKMNAYTTQMGVEIAEAMLRADADSDVRVIVMTGAGDRAFCAGADMGMFARDIKSREGGAADDKPREANDSETSSSAAPASDSRSSCATSPSLPSPRSTASRSASDAR